MAILHDYYQVERMVELWKSVAINHRVITTAINPIDLVGK